MEQDLDYYKLLPDLPDCDDDGTVERVDAHQFDTANFDEQWRHIIENANAVVNGGDTGRFLPSAVNPFDPQVPDQCTPLFARDTFDVRKGYHSQKVEFGVQNVVQELKAGSQIEAATSPGQHYAVEICPQGRVTTLQSLQRSVERTLSMHQNMLTCISNVVTLLDDVVSRLNKIDDTLKENTNKRRRTSKEFLPRAQPAGGAGPKKLR